MKALSPNLAKPLSNAWTDSNSSNKTMPEAPHHALDVSNGASDDTANAIRSGAWERGLLCCLDTNAGAVLNSITSCCLPCLPIAQVSQRLGLANYWFVLALLVLLMVAEYAIVRSITWENRTTSYLWLVTEPTIYGIHEAVYSEEIHAENIYLQDTVLSIHIAYGMWAFVGVVPGFLMVLSTWILRMQMRARFHISGWCGIDLLVAFICPCCTVAQLASHVKIPKPRGCNVGPVDTLPAFPEH